MEPILCQTNVVVIESETPCPVQVGPALTGKLWAWVKLFNNHEYHLRMFDKKCKSPYASF